MKRMVMILIAISVMGIAELANAGITDLPSYSRITNLLDNYISALDVAQADFFAVNNKYYQGLDLADGQPNGVNNVTTDPTNKPSDQEFDWLDFAPQVFAMSLALPVNIRIDTHNSAPDWGYTITFELWRDLGPDAKGNEGNHWVYKYYFGPNPDLTAIYDEWFIMYDGDI